ncbi:mRNA 3'-end-processing protein rna14 [Anopheles sinensis]|uniref:mRNA 3'-end-processing protein rna14 n=1 Tax=Anopheles sinensis TaxID=74873 RepID=A0A084W593_ANOSI|nr:mRNA 3'-end-processing protein rna14 [Anopheles sinensis]
MSASWCSSVDMRFSTTSKVAASGRATFPSVEPSILAVRSIFTGRPVECVQAQLRNPRSTVGASTELISGYRERRKILDTGRFVDECFFSSFPSPKFLFLATLFVYHSKKG